jgi:methyl-accepting chemotaxis protein
MSLSKQELVEDYKETLEHIFDEIEDIRADIKNVDNDELGSLIAALDFVDERLHNIAVEVEDLIAVYKEG